MNDDRITFEILNAYVDGELDAASAALVARAIAENPAVARQVSALSRLRLAVAASAEASDFQRPVAPLFDGRLLAFAVTVSLALFVAGTALMTRFDRPTGSAWLARAFNIHQGWSAASARTAGGDGALLRIDHAAAVPGAYVPDLSAARLTLVHAAVVPFTGKHQALLVGYRGNRGCKISLIAFPPPEGLGTVFNLFRQDHQEGYAWRAGDIAYAILSDGMESKRFRLIAESVRNTSYRHLPFDAKTRVALSRARDNSTPCSA